MDSAFTEQYGDLQRWHWWFRGRQRIVDALLDAAVRKQGALRIVSLGSGPAPGLAPLAVRCMNGGILVGCDMMPGDQRVAGTSMIASRLESLPLREGTFDVVLLLDVLEHVDDDASILASAARLCRPGGVVLATVPACPSLWGAQDVVSHHRRRYTRRSLTALFSKVHLVPTRIGYFNSFLFPVIASIRWMRALLPGRGAPQSDFAGSHPGAMNDALSAVFGAERHVVTRWTLPIGVSLFAVAAPGGTC